MKPIPLALPAPRQILMPVGPLDAATIRRLCGIERKHEFEIHPTFGRCHCLESESWPYKGSYKKWFKLTNQAHITSYATVSAGMVTIHHAAHPVFTRLAPSGMIFAVDQHGLLLRRVSDGMDFHPGLSDLLSRQFSGLCRRSMAANFKRRMEMRKAERLATRNQREKARLHRLFERDQPTTRVTLNDSRLAGNCVEGSLAFAEKKLGLNREAILAAAHLFSVSARRLLSVSNGDRPRVEAAARIAWQRETAVCI